MAVVCHPNWVEWVLDSNRVDAVIGFHAPWTDRTDKYQFDKYRVADFLALRRKLKPIGPDVLCELRGDVRNLILLKSLGLCKVVNLVGRRFANRYERPRAILDRLGVHPAPAAQFTQLRRQPHQTDAWHIVVFFSAAWENRTVPAPTAQAIANALLRTGLRISVVLPNHGSLASWYPVSLPGLEPPHLIRGSVAEVCRAISEADACLSTDSGFLHVAHLYGLPVFGLFGFATEDEWAPPGCTIIRSTTIFPATARYAKAGETLDPLAELDPDLIALKVLQGLREHRASLFDVHHAST